MLEVFVEFHLIVFEKKPFYIVQHLYATTVMHCKIKQVLRDPLALTEGFNIMVCKNVSAYFTVTYNHKT